MDHDRRDISTPGEHSSIGIMPVAMSLSNAPPTTTPHLRWVGRRRRRQEIQ